MSNLIQNQFFLEILQIFLLGWLRSAQGQWDFQTFAVHNDKIISSSDTVVGKRTIRSSVMCANLCVGRDNCCSATYKQDTLECILDSCCNPTMENSTPTSVMLKPFNAGNTLEVSIIINTVWYVGQQTVHKTTFSTYIYFNTFILLSVFNYFYRFFPYRIQDHVSRGRCTHNCLMQN